MYFTRRTPMTDLYGCLLCGACKIFDPPVELWLKRPDASSLGSSTLWEFTRGSVYLWAKNLGRFLFSGFVCCERSRFASLDIITGAEIKGYTIHLHVIYSFLSDCFRDQGRKKTYAVPRLVQLVSVTPSGHRSTHPPVCRLWAGHLHQPVRLHAAG